MDVLVLSEREVEQLLDPKELLDALEGGFRDLSAGEVLAPDRPEISIPAGFLLAMPAHRPGSDITVKMVSVFHGNDKLGLPGHLALICGFDPETGAARYVMDGTHVTALRTAGAAAVSARLLAREDARVMTILGAGVQGRSHLQLFPLIRDIEEIRVGSLRFEDAQRLAESDPRARAVESFEEAVRGSDIVCLCSTANEPLIELGWLKEGAHVTSVGYMPPGGELPAEVIDAGTLFVEARLAFEKPPVGCDELAGRDPETGTELGEVVLGRRPGRRSDGELTVCKTMGHAVEDMVAAQLAYERARREGAGTLVEL